jgi:4a-hydroxytetrahydrobiopterin dehydratase
MRLSESDIAGKLQGLAGWARSGQEIAKEFVFSDFTAAMSFVTAVALIAEKANHHPDIDIRWNKVTLTLSTHSAGGLTEKDFALAQKIEDQK